MRPRPSRRRVAREEHHPPEVWQLRTGTSAVAFAAGTPVGIAGWHRPESTGTTELVGMWVHPRHRGSDVASRLVAHVVAATAGEQLVLHVVPSNARALALYTKAGFVADGTDVIEGGPLLRMRRDDAPAPD